MNRCIVSCAYGNARYLPYVDRLEANLRAHDYADRIMIWRDEWPPNSPSHKNAHYAFKYHAVRWAFEQGFRQVLWLDSACYAKAPLDPIWKMLETRGVYCVAGDEPLGEWISDQALDRWNVSRNQAMGLVLCGGAILGLDFSNPVAGIFLEKWGWLAQSGLFQTAHSKACPDRMRSVWIEDGSETIVASDPRVKGHRSDEACFSLLLHELYVSPVHMEAWNLTMGSGYDL